MPSPRSWCPSNTRDVDARRSRSRGRPKAVTWTIPTSSPPTSTAHDGGTRLEEPAQHLELRRCSTTRAVCGPAAMRLAAVLDLARARHAQDHASITPQDLRRLGHGALPSYSDDSTRHARCTETGSGRIMGARRVAGGASRGPVVAAEGHSHEVLHRHPRRRLRLAARRSRWPHDPAGSTHVRTLTPWSPPASSAWRGPFPRARNHRPRRRARPSWATTRSPTSSGVVRSRPRAWASRSSRARSPCG